MMSSVSSGLRIRFGMVGVGRLQEGAQAELGGRGMLGDLEQRRANRGVDHLILGYQMTLRAHLAREAGARGRVPGQVLS
jgi:hypothetical protein